MTKWACLCVLMGCGSSVVINNHNTQTAPQAAAPEGRADFNLRLRVQGSTGESGSGEGASGESGTATTGSATSSSSVRVSGSGGNGSGGNGNGGNVNGGALTIAEELAAIGEMCEGVTVDMTGETRSGRALGMGLLQVYARPGAELLVDERPEGETPLIAVGVDAGPRDVRLRNAPLGYDCTFRLRVLPGTRYSILLDVKPELAAR